MPKFKPLHELSLSSIRTQIRRLETDLSTNRSDRLRELKAEQNRRDQLEYAAVEFEIVRRQDPTQTGRAILSEVDADLIRQLHRFPNQAFSLLRTKARELELPKSFAADFWLWDVLAIAHSSKNQSDTPPFVWVLGELGTHLFQVYNDRPKTADMLRILARQGTFHPDSHFFLYHRGQLFELNNPETAADACEKLVNNPERTPTRC